MNMRYYLEIKNYNNLCWISQFILSNINCRRMWRKYCIDILFLNELYVKLCIEVILSKIQLKQFRFIISGKFGSFRTRK